MGILDKIKNVFFEEEEVEEEETKEIMKTPVAKKIDVGETSKKEEREAKNNESSSSNTLAFDSKDEPVEKDFKFPMGFDDKDFEVEKTIEIFGPVKEKEESVPEVVHEEEVESDLPPVETTYTVETQESYEEVEYSEPVVEQPKIESRENYHKLYEGREKEKDKEEKPGFTPSPIISPIYGILNKNYKKEQIVTRSEIRKNETVIKKDNLDIVREKAYGDLAGEISASIEDDLIDIEEDKPKEKEDLLYDLNTEESPTVKTVTVGDAEEYFNDLGLEYNVDYKVEKNEENEKKTEEEPKRELKRETKKEKEDETDSDDKNLFDLIDAMYEDEER